MVQINNSKNKAYCVSCGKHLPDNLYDIEVGTAVAGGNKIYEINGLCETCLKELAITIIKKV